MHWNAGGWFGGQLGATIWVLIAGILTVIRDLTTGLLVLGLFLIPNVIGLATYWIIGLVFGGLMIMFYLRFGRGGNGPEA